MPANRHWALSVRRPPTVTRRSCLFGRLAVCANDPQMLPAAGRCDASICSLQAGDATGTRIGRRGTDTTNGHHGSNPAQKRKTPPAPKRLRGNDLRFMGLGRVELVSSTWFVLQ